jgi:alginate O-acetyltransferase complex protein AlgI
VGALVAGFQRLPLPAQAACLAACLVVTDTLGPTGVAPFIYFRF